MHTREFISLKYAKRKRVYVYLCWTNAKAWIILTLWMCSVMSVVGVQRRTSADTSGKIIKASPGGNPRRWNKIFQKYSIVVVLKYKSVSSAALGFSCSACSAEKNSVHAKSIEQWMFFPLQSQILIPCSNVNLAQCHPLLLHLLNQLEAVWLCHTVLDRCHPLLLPGAALWFKALILFKWQQRWARSWRS